MYNAKLEGQISKSQTSWPNSEGRAFEAEFLKDELPKAKAEMSKPRLSRVELSKAEAWNIQTPRVKSSNAKTYSKAKTSKAETYSKAMTLRLKFQTLKISKMLIPRNKLRDPESPRIYRILT